MGIAEIVSGVPEASYSTTKLIKSFGDRISDEVAGNIENLGVEKRHLAFTPKGKEEEVSDVCLRALKKSLGKRGTGKEELGALIVTSDASDYLSPGLSGLLAGKLSAPYVSHYNIQGMACVAFQKSLELAGKLYDGKPLAIVLSGCNSSWFINQARLLEDVKGPDEIKGLAKGERAHETRKWLAVIQACLFGDGASAIIWDEGGYEIEKSSSISNLNKSDYKSAYFTAGLNRGFETETIAHLGRLGDIGIKYCRNAVESLGARADEIDQWALHTGSRKILDAVGKELGIGKEKMKESYDILTEHGNLAGASLPFILERIMKTDAKNVLALGYGWGFCASASLMRL